MGRGCIMDIAVVDDGWDVVRNFDFIVNVVVVVD